MTLTFLSTTKHPLCCGLGARNIVVTDKYRRGLNDGCIWPCSSFSQDPKRKVHKHVKGTITLEVERLQHDDRDVETVSSSGSLDREERFLDQASSRQGRHSSGRKSLYHGKHRASSDVTDQEISHLSHATRGGGDNDVGSASAGDSKRAGSCNPFYSSETAASV